MAKSSIIKKKSDGPVKVKSNVKKKQAPAVIPKLPEDWPVQSHPPTIPANASALAPGTLLREVCHGTDIQLNKQALAEPSIIKEKGKYLLSFPGSFSFQNLIANNEKSSQELEPLATQDVDEEADGDDDAMDDTEKNDDPSIQTSKSGGNNNTATANTTQSTPNVTPTLGKVVGLATRHPQFRIPFPDRQQVLVFPGTKMDTASKFMWLACSTRRKGSVTCKSIFSSVIVFGMPKWEPMESSTEENGTDDPNGGISLTQASEVTTATTTTAKEFRHFGGSERTIDGVGKGRKKKGPQEVSTETEHIPIVSRMVTPTKSGPLSMSIPSSSFLHRNPGTTGDKSSSAVKQNDDEEEEEIEILSDEEFTPASADIVTSTKKERSAPRRQSSAKKAKYTYDLESETSENDDDDGDGSDADDTVETAEKSEQSKKSRPAPKKTPAKKPAAARKTPAKSSQKKAPKEAIVIESEDEYKGDDSEEEVDEVENKDSLTIRRQRRTSRSTTSYKDDDDDDDDDPSDSDADEDGVDSTPVQTNKSANTAKRASKAGAKNTKSVKATTPDSEIKSTGSASAAKPKGRQPARKTPPKGQAKTPRQAPKKATPASRKKPSPATKAKETKTTKRPRASADNKENPPTKAARTTTSPALATPGKGTPTSINSPFRSRRKSPAGNAKKSVAKKIFDVEQDDVFRF